MTNKEENKDKLRVYEYAKSLNMSSKEIITILKRLNIPVNNHMSVMENDAVNNVEKFFRDIKANAAAKRAASDGGNVNSSTTNTKQQAATNQTKENVNSDQSIPSAAPQVQVTANSTPGTPAGNTQQQQGVQPPRRTDNQYVASRPAQPSQGQRTDSRPQGQSQTSRPADQRSNQGGQRTGEQRPPYRQGEQRPSGYAGNNPRPAGQSAGGPSQGQGGANRSSSTGQAPRQGQGSFGQNANRPASSGTPNRSQGTNRPGARPYDNNRGPQGQGGRPIAQEAKPQFRPGATAEEIDDAAAKAAGKIVKKPARPTPSRFDDNRPGGNNRGNNRGGNRHNRGKYQQDSVKKEKIDNTPKKIIVRGTMTVGELAKLLHKDASEVIKKLLFLGVMATINQELDMDAILLVSGEFGVEVEVKIRVEEDNFENVEEVDNDEDLIERPAVVTIMGHVDHGKTTLLDAIRETNVTEGEAGGITQHIGAYQVDVHNKKITFLDTPGHEAFTVMRARGAQVTDITILVVAADDGVMPQTVEAISHAKAAGVPIIVAINKIDKPGSDPDRIKQALTEYELVPEEWGGDTIFVELSAKQRIGLENLLETIILVAEVQEYKANPNKRARGTVIEAELDKGRGPVARILIQNGTLKVGDSFVAGVCFGRVRAMVNDKGKRLKEAGPSTPVEITGLTEVPQAGDPFIVFEDERKARDIAERRAITLRQSEMGANSRVTLDDLYKHIKDGEIKDLNVIIKGDVQGSVEALKGSLEKIEVEGARVKILHTGAGAITESDIILASASNAIIIGFNVRPEPAAQATAEQEKVDIRLHRIIYNAIEEIEQAMKGILDPIFKENVLGRAEVRNVFKVTGVGY